MTSILEKTISVIAPNHCFSCSKESNILCESCAAQVFGEDLEVCFLCNKPTIDARVCPTCRRQTVLSRVWMAAEYEGVIKAVIRAFKFERLRSAYKPLASGMDATLPYFAQALVVHVPTASQRIRQRGYDQAQLLARELARQRGWDQATLLRRRHDLRQVGTGRTVRLQQASEAFEIIARRSLADAPILLVDDVTTSGATLVAAARVLHEAGATNINAVVVAKHTLE